MAAYILVDSEVIDPVLYQRYRELTPAAIARYGGRFLVRGGETEVLEGNWQPHRVIVLEFPSMEAVRTFYDSPEYREARDVRKDAANMSMIAVAGV